MTHPRDRRREECRRIREEGRAAALAGKHRQTCPYGTASPNWMRWCEGYDDGAREMAIPDDREELLAMGHAVVADLLKSTGGTLICQDYGRLNDFLLRTQRYVK